MDFDDQEGNTKRERPTNLAKLTNLEPYEIIKYLANIKCNITFGQILDKSQIKVRINQKFKIRKN